MTWAETVIVTRVAVIAAVNTSAVYIPIKVCIICKTREDNLKIFQKNFNIVESKHYSTYYTSTIIIGY